MSHSFQAPSGRTYFYNGDLSGGFDFDGSYDYISEEDFRALVALYITGQRMSRLEKMSTDQVIASLL